jgi:hypothetical protein
MDLRTALAVEVSVEDVGEVDSDLASCLAEASRSLHRATVALGCVESDRRLRPDGVMGRIGSTCRRRSAAS